MLGSAVPVTFPELIARPGQGLLSPRRVCTRPRGEGRRLGRNPPSPPGPPGRRRGLCAARFAAGRGAGEGERDGRTDGRTRPGCASGQRGAGRPRRQLSRAAEEAATSAAHPGKSRDLPTALLLLPPIAAPRPAESGAAGAAPAGTRWLCDTSGTPGCGDRAGAARLERRRGKERLPARSGGR